MNEKNVTIKDIARKANVSKSTVSRVLNDSTPVNEAKRQAVLDAMKELNFRPNVFARSLAGGKSMTIGIVTGDIGSPFYDSISKGVIEALNSTKYTAIIADGQWQESRERNAMSTLVNRQVDGLLAIGGTLDIEAINEFGAYIPLVMVARKEVDWEDRCIYINNKEAAKVAVNHLIGLGHKRIAHIMGDATHRDAIDRYAGYKEAMDEAGLEVEEDLFAQGDFTLEGGETAMATLLDKGAEMTAVFSANDQMAFGARLTLFRRNVSVPDEVSIIGFDNQTKSPYAIPPLTTIAQPGLAMGRTATEMLFDLINKKPTQGCEFSCQLIIRESVRKLS